MKRFIATGIIGLVAAALLLLAAFAAGPSAEIAARVVARDAGYYRAYYSLAAAILLAIPAFWLFILQRKSGPGDAWRGLWTFGFVAYAAYLYWAARRGGWGLAPGLEWAVAAWWGLDLVLAWAAPRAAGWVKFQRGGAHLAVFLALALAAIPAGPGLSRFLGVALVAASLAAAAIRTITREFDPATLSGRLYTGAFSAINRVIPWHGFPTPLAVLNLGAFREILRAKNLHGTDAIPATRPEGLAQIPPFDPDFLAERNPDGYYNDLAEPGMGSAGGTAPDVATSEQIPVAHPGARFGRNVPLERAYPEPMPGLMEPSPREISRALLARRAFIPAPSLNLLAAAWIQFQTHDWFNHGDPQPGNELEVPVGEGDAWHECPMRVRRTRPDPTRDYAAEASRAASEPGYRPPPPTYTNAESHWWDGSQIYGSSRETIDRLRRGPDGRVLPDGKLVMRDGRLSVDPGSGVALSGFTGNWWVGLSMLHTIFTLEHNAVCDRLRRDYPAWDGDHIFAVAKLVISALMAKIHTVEWTPAILAHPALEVGMNANWWGLATERIRKLLGRISENEAFSGIPGSGVDHHSADYSLTEEFVAVYRMHPLMPDGIRICSADDGRELRGYAFPDGILGDEAGLKVLGDGATMTDLFYSFGIAHPGALTLHNYPEFLRRLARPDGQTLDLASIDILRDRER